MSFLLVQDEEGRLAADKDRSLITVHMGVRRRALCVSRVQLKGYNKCVWEWARHLT